MTEMTETDTTTNGRTRLLEAALELFSTQSFDKVSTSHVAAKAGVAHGLVFHHFGSKGGLFLEVLDALIGQIDEAISRTPRGGAPAEIIRGWLRRHLALVTTHSAWLRMFMRGAPGLPAATAEIFELRIREAGLRRLTELLGIEHPRPVLRFVLHSWVGFLDEATLSCLEQPRVIRRADLVEVLLEHLTLALRQAKQLDPRVDLALAEELVAATPG